ncbi:MAG: ATPase [Pseudomonadota bacterium]
MTSRTASLLALFLVGASVNIARSEVLDSGPVGFTSANEVVVSVDRTAAWKAAMSIGQWWHPDHTIGGDATALSIDARAMGCFCESLADGGGVVHLTVTTVSPNVLLRMTGGLGPLGLMGVNGNMTWEFIDHDDGTLIRFTYAVGGYAKDGLEGAAGPVEFVIGEALERLATYIETGSPTTAPNG